MDVDDLVAAARAAAEPEASADERGPRLELTTVTTTSATFHEATTTEVIAGLQPATDHEHRGISFRTLARPAGRLRTRVATVNDVHFGEVEAGRLSGSDLGPIQRRPPGTTPYPELMNRTAVDEMVASEQAAGPFAAIVVKGDLSSEGTDEQFAAFERCYRPPFGDRLHVVRGNHDAYRGQDAYAGDAWIELPGVAVALIDSTVPFRPGGSFTAEQAEWLDSHAAGSTAPVIVMAHHPLALGDPADNPEFIVPAEPTALIEDVFRRQRAIVAYTAGHTHRHRVQHAAGGVVHIEVGCVKDFPGTWAEYEVYDGGILQVVHRLSSPDALAWSEQCRGLYADFGVDYTHYALGQLEDRCLSIALR